MIPLLLKLLIPLLLLLLLTLLLLLVPIRQKASRMYKLPLGIFKKEAYFGTIFSIVWLLICRVLQTLKTFFKKVLQTTVLQTTYSGMLMKFCRMPVAAKKLKV
jgi:hypothetical protein